MPTGTVKWFNNAKGYGFILPDEGNEDLFAHYSTITMEGYKTLKAGQQVSFDISEGAKGLHAINISCSGVPDGDSNNASSELAFEAGADNKAAIDEEAGAKADPEVLA